MLRLPDRILLEHSGLDAFFFVRYIRTFAVIFTILSISILLCLIPLNLVGGNDIAWRTHGLDRLSWANIGPQHTTFCWAHLAASLFVITFVCYIIYAKLLFYVAVRRSYLVSFAHRHSEAANTVLMTDIPEEDLSVLKKIFDVFPRGVHFVFINRNLTGLSAKMRARQALVAKLKSAETSLVISAIASYRQRRRQHGARAGLAAEKEGLPWRRAQKERHHFMISRKIHM